MYARYPRRAVVGAVSVVMMTALMVWGCGESTDLGGVDTPADPVPDRIEETSRMRASLYDPSNPYTAATVDRLLGRRDVDAAVSAFEDRGMEFAPEDCIVIEGTGADGTTRVTFIGMKPAAGVDEVGLVACVERGDDVVVAPGFLSANEPRGKAGGRQLVPGVWSQSLPAQAPERWSPDQWDKFWDCLLNSVPGPATACLFGCAFTGPGYMHCVYVCVGSQAIAATVKCAVSITLAGSSCGKEQNAQ